MSEPRDPASTVLEIAAATLLGVATVLGAFAATVVKLVTLPLA